MVIGVLVEITNKNVDKIFDYLVPKEYIEKIKIGIRVNVLFGKRKVEGFVIDIKNKSEVDNLKYIDSIVDDEVVLNSELLELGKYIKEKTLSSLISCYQIMLPKALKASYNTNINKKYKKIYLLNDYNYNNINEKQKKIIDLFKISNKKYLDSNDLKNTSKSSLNTLIKKDIIKVIKQEDYRFNYKDYQYEKKILNKDQKIIVDNIKLNKYNKYLLYGVTGSGKTEVYLEIIEKVLNMGKTAIFLVPEISLTPQMIERFSKRFPNIISTLHSRLSNGEKYDEWRKVESNKAKIVIGARSAIFSPLENIGVIIIDEEHSTSYKQEDKNPKYNAIDIAFKRAKTHNCPVILGSATPTIEDFIKAKKNIYKLLVLEKRANQKALPKVEIIDMNKEIKNSNNYISKYLIDEIIKRVEKDEQVILLLNRRGYSNFVMCKNCGYTYKCPNCDISLTLHKTNNILRCHYCGYGTSLDKTCPKCHEMSLNNLGVGTQKIEEYLSNNLGLSVIRMDYDTTTKKGSYEKILEDFKNKKAHILLGTQVVAKGLDFKDVSLVGIINADTSLNIPDFRSSEYTYQLISQTSGRSGRGDIEGKVIIQTFNPDNYTILCAKDHNYIKFIENELKIRKELKYPPYYYLTSIKISGKDFKYIYNEAIKIKNILTKNLNNTIILGPTTSFIFKLNNIYRYNIIIKNKDNNILYPILKEIDNHYIGNNKIHIDINFNPTRMD